MVGIINYGVGNLFSLKSSLNYLGFDTQIMSDINDLKKADKLILPGVGAFKDAYKQLEVFSLVEPIKEMAKEGKPLLGICLGMQLLFEKSYEYGVQNGLGLLRGEVVSIAENLKSYLKVPHMGWNSLNLIDKSCKILKYTNEGDYVYYVHSYYAKGCDDSLKAYSDYGVKIAGVVNQENIYGTQFHPEKSGETGLKILKAFCEL